MQSEGVPWVNYDKKLDFDLQMKPSNLTETLQASRLTCGVFVNDHRLHGFVLHSIDSIRTSCSVLIHV